MAWNVSSEALEKLALYESLLIKWQAKINLVSTATLKTARTRHFEDSLQLEPLIPSGAQIVYDLGSGAGFPGLVLAIARPDLRVTLIESDSKKCAFLQTISRETDTKVSIIQERIEKAVHSLPAPDVITARALAPLESLLSYSEPWLLSRPDVAMICLKGGGAGVEVQGARNAGWDFDLEEIPSTTDSSGHILSLSNIYKKT